MYRLRSAVGLVLGAQAFVNTATTPATRGAAMGGYSTAIYVGFGAPAFGLVPAIGAWGYATGFALVGACAVITTAGAAAIWGRSGQEVSEAGLSG